MRYISTRGGTPPMGFADAVLTGLAPDGGLLLPERLPDMSGRLEALAKLSYVDLAETLIAEFVDDIPRADLRRIVRDAYATFDHPDVTPLVALSREHVLELFHGPTLAFKDVALQFLGRVFEYLLAARDEQLNILGATSGDTGSAAIAGVRGRDRIRIFIMYPHQRTSRLQELQMISVLDDNVHNLAVRGSFDDCQAIMKEIFNDLPFKQRYQLGAVNSVNWARVLAQVVYYFYAGLRVGGPTTFSVPTGNFGDIFAGYIAARMGLPVAKLVLATNENDILSVFFNTGAYRRGSVHQTISPSMDIQVASNFERFLFYRFDGDAARVRAFLDAFQRTGEARIDDGKPIDDLIVATAVGTDETLRTIASVQNEEGYLLDPHTAVGVAAARRLAVPAPVVCLATAHPAKFPEAIGRVLDPALARHPRLTALESLPTRRTVIDASIEQVKQFLSTVVDGEA
jgi:threonine synthase